MLKWLLLGCVAALAGCENTTETGYTRKLGDSETEQRGYYAALFSPESQAAERSRSSDSKDRFGTPAGDWRPTH
jgi:hypothetical protein